MIIATYIHNISLQLKLLFSSSCLNYNILAFVLTCPSRTYLIDLHITFDDNGARSYKTRQNSKGIRNKCTDLIVNISDPNKSIFWRAIIQKHIDAHYL